ncbi:MAG: PKD domain-containing protein [Bacteroidota bacterium]|jgi:PKD repeat protein
MNKNKLDSFENSIKDSYKNYEMPYSPADWGSLSKTLFKKRLLSSAAFWGAVLVVGVGAGVFAGGMYFYSVQPTAQVKSNATANDLQTQDQNTPVQGMNTQEQNQEVAENAINQNNPLLGTNQENEATENISELFTSEDLNGNNAGGNSNSDQLISGNESQQKNSDRNLTIIPSIKTACAGSPVEFHAKNSNANGSYLWNFGDGSFSNEENPVHTFKKAGTFDISLSITNPNDGQISTVAMRGLITILPKPNAEFVVDFEPSTANQAQVTLKNTTTSFETFSWQFSNGQSSNEKSPSLLYGLNGKHQIKLDVSNEHGCTDVQNASVRMNDSNKYQSVYELRASKIVFLPKDLIDNNAFKLIILHDKQPIFESTSLNKVWNGGMKSGSKAQAGQEFSYILTTFNAAKMEYNYFQGKIQIVP